VISTQLMFGVERLCTTCLYGCVPCGLQSQAQILMVYVPDTASWNSPVGTVWLSDRWSCVGCQTVALGRRLMRRMISMNRICCWLVKLRAAGGAFGGCSSGSQGPHLLLPHSLGESCQHVRVVNGRVGGFQSSEHEYSVTVTKCCVFECSVRECSLAEWTSEKCMNEA
jgi:hypothetical protein